MSPSNERNRYGVPNSLQLRVKLVLYQLILFCQISSAAASAQEREAMNKL